MILFKNNKWTLLRLSDSRCQINCFDYPQFCGSLLNCVNKLLYDTKYLSLEDNLILIKLKQEYLN